MPCGEACTKLSQVSAFISLPFNTTASIKAGKSKKAKAELLLNGAKIKREPQAPFLFYIECLDLPVVYIAFFLSSYHCFGGCSYYATFFRFLIVVISVKVKIRHQVCLYIVYCFCKSI